MRNVIQIIPFVAFSGVALATSSGVTDKLDLFASQAARSRQQPQPLLPLRPSEIRDINTEPAEPDCIGQSSAGVLYAAVGGYSAVRFASGGSVDALYATAAVWDLGEARSPGLGFVSGGTGLPGLNFTFVADGPLARGGGSYSRGGTLQVVRPGDTAAQDEILASARIILICKSLQG